MTKYDAIKTLQDHKICFEHDFGWNKSVLDALDIAIKALDTDAVPVRHAIWRYKTMTVPGGRGQTYAKWSCTACKAKQKERSNYCPNCGAKMDMKGVK